jgi:DNA-binding response OmpR family regulator
MAQVLLIEDDANIARIIQRGLALKGISVTVADDGCAGQLAWSSGHFHLIILDVMLPGIDGLQLCTERRAAGDATPVLLLTARSQVEIGDRGRLAGATEYLRKPFAYAQLVETVFRLLTQAGTQEADQRSETRDQRPET